jgi:hypothetical protein
MMPASATAFLRLLDPDARGFTFQTFDDNKERARAYKAEHKRADPARTKIIIGEPDKMAAQLDALNRDGNGIYVTVNETDGVGRKIENIKRVRAVWQEDDDGYAGEFTAQPSIVVATSPGRNQRYWLTNWPADERGAADFAGVMERMISDYGSDKDAKDISRVLRLPGFFHRKGVPFLARMISAAGHRYSRNSILEAFPPVEREPLPPRRPWVARADDDARLSDALGAIDPDDRSDWIRVGMALKAHLGDAGFDLWDHWSAGSGKYEAADQQYRWRTFGRRSGVTISTVFYLARRAGWHPPPPPDREAWRACGLLISRLSPITAFDLFLKWCSEQSIARDRAEEIFGAIAQKELRK